MNIPATSLVNFQTQAKELLINKRNSFGNINKPTKNKSKLLLSPIIPKKNTNKLNNILVLSSKKETIRPIATADKKGVLLYQQIERNKTFSNGIELMNRFHFKI